MLAENLHTWRCAPFRQGQLLNALEAAAEVVSKGSGAWSETELLIQTQHSAVQLQSGTVTGYWSGENFAALQPPWPEASSPVFVPGEELQVRGGGRCQGSSYQIAGKL